MDLISMEAPQITTFTLSSSLGKGMSTRICWPFSCFVKRFCEKNSTIQLRWAYLAVSLRPILQLDYNLFYKIYFYFSRIITFPDTQDSHSDKTPLTTIIGFTVGGIIILVVIIVLIIFVGKYSQFKCSMIFHLLNDATLTMVFVPL